MGAVEWPGLVEREYELEAIDAALARADEGAGVFLLFDGEPGIGKSALLHEHHVSTLVNWKQGEDVIISGSVSNDRAKEIFGEWEEPKSYIRIAPQPNGKV